MQPSLPNPQMGTGCEMGCLDNLPAALLLPPAPSVHPCTLACRASQLMRLIKELFSTAPLLPQQGLVIRTCLPIRPQALPNGQEESTHEASASGQAGGQDAPHQRLRQPPPGGYLRTVQGQGPSLQAATLAWQQACHQLRRLCCRPLEHGRQCRAQTGAGGRDALPLGSAQSMAADHISIQGQRRRASP